MYIKDLLAISPQPTFDGSFFKGNVNLFKGNHYTVTEPDYAGIPNGLLRRMSKGSRMGVKAGMELLQKYPEVEGIIMGTADAGIEDSLKFVHQIIEYEEGRLTPTNFVQSTSNSLTGILALMTKNYGYNSTYVDKGSAFESALLDAQMQFENNEAKTLLVGGLELFYEQYYNMEYLSGLYKREECSSKELLDSNTPGTVNGEGCAMFIMSSEKEDSVAEIVDTHQITLPNEEELLSMLNDFLTRNGLETVDVEALVLGYSGDNRDDFYYDLVKQQFDSSIGTYSYKNLVGEYPTVSSFAIWMAANLVNGKSLPEEAILKASGTPKTVLVYNHHRSNKHCFTLVRS